MSDAVHETIIRARRVALSKPLQIAVFRRDGWLCCWCKRPVIFAPIMKFLERELRAFGTDDRLAYYHAHWTRDGAPLLDLLGAVIDHIEAFSAGGADDIDNLATACNKCNGRKSATTLDRWGERPLERPIKGKYGEPQHWDGLSSMFVILARRDATALTTCERAWLQGIASAALKRNSGTATPSFPRKQESSRRLVPTAQSPAYAGTRVLLSLILCESAKPVGGQRLCGKFK